MKLFQRRTLGLIALTLVVSSSAFAQTNGKNPVDAAKKRLAVGHVVKDFQLRSVGGELSGDVRLSEVNADGPVVIVFLRGFPGAQCPACSAQVADLVRHADQFTAKDTRVLLIYPGAKLQLEKHADDFLQGTRLPEPLTFLLDPGLKVIQSYGLRWDAPNETSYPTTIVIDEDGKITFIKISDTHRGRAAAEEILEAL